MLLYEIHLARIGATCIWIYGCVSSQHPHTTCPGVHAMHPTIAVCSTRKQNRCMSRGERKKERQTIVRSFVGQSHSCTANVNYHLWFFFVAFLLFEYGCVFSSPSRSILCIYVSVARVRLLFALPWSLLFPLSVRFTFFEVLLPYSSVVLFFRCNALQKRL